MTDPGETVLQPVTDFMPHDLGLRLAELTAGSKALLAARHLLGPLKRYADEETARDSVVKAKNLHKAGIQEIFVVIGEAGDPEGLATIQPNLALNRLRLPIPVGVGEQKHVKKLRDKFNRLDWLAEHYVACMPYTGPNLTAWTVAGQEEALATAYQDLDFRTSLASDSRSKRPWTIEPRRSPASVHEAIGSTSLSRITTGRFDDQESKRKVPPVSVLYAKIYYEWLTARGRMKELRTGRQSWMSDINRRAASMGPAK